MDNNEFRSFMTAIRTRAEGVKFDKLVHLLNSEEMHVQRDNTVDSSQLTSSASVFLATQGSGYEIKVSKANMSNTYVSSQVTSGGKDKNTDSFQGMVPNPSTQNMGSNQSGIWFNSAQSIACQICGKTNHLAHDCFHRANLSFRPPKYQVSQFGQRGFNSSRANGRNFTQVRP